MRSERGACFTYSPILKESMNVAMIDGSVLVRASFRALGGLHALDEFGNINEKQFSLPCGGDKCY